MNEKEPESSEEFFRVPKAEFIIERHRGVRSLKGNPLPLELSSYIKNDSMSIPSRMSLEVAESGMEKSGIQKGDHVVLEKSAEYYEGEILVVKLDDRTFLRRLYNTKGRLRLESDSSNTPTIIVENRTPGFSILGRIVQVIKEVK